MYEKFFGLTESPFSIAPDPKFLYMSERHREALAHLLYGITTDGGFVLLTGEVGTGKTTVSRCLLEQMPRNTNVAYVLNPKVMANELLATICDDLNIEYPDGTTSIKVYVDCINAYLLKTNAQGRKTIVIIEESQNLTADVLEQLRLLTNLETSQRKLLQIVMIGQPEFLEILKHPGLTQLAQRITARYHLQPMTMQETGEYVSHRLSVAGMTEPVFTAPVLRLIYQLSGGIPRRINLLCDRALLGAFVQSVRIVDSKTLKKAAIEAYGEIAKGPRLGSPRNTIAWTFAGLAAVVTGVGLASVFFNPPIATSVIKQNPTTGIVTYQSKVNDISSESLETIKLLKAHSAKVSKFDAYRALFSQWRAKLKATENLVPCKSATTQSLACLRKNGNLNSLTHLNRPAVLWFVNDQGEPIYATITAIEGNQASLIFGNQRRDILLEDLDSIWFGGYTVLWSVPLEFHRSMTLGDKGADVEWLARQLDTIIGTEKSKGTSSFFGVDLLNNVKKFQLQVGLISDGIVGEETIIHINTAMNIDVPMLVEDSDDEITL